MSTYSRPLKINLAHLFLALTAPIWAETLSGTVSRSDDVPVPHAFVGLMGAEFDLIAHGASGADGEFTIDAPDDVSYVVVQPPAKENAQGLGIYDAQPRVHDIAPQKATPQDPGKAADSPVELRLPPAGCLVLKAYGPDGHLMRWEDFTRQGTFGRQFMYATDLDDQMVPAVCWPVYDEEARSQGSPREKGLPALVVEPGAAYVAQVLFWEVPDYGKLLLRADNAGEGFALDAPGTAHVIELNVELARTAVADLERRKEAYPTDGQAKIAPVREALARALEETTTQERAAAANRVLALALSLRDMLELEAARAAIPGLRTGSLTVQVRDAAGAPIPGCRIRLSQEVRDFRFGVFEGSPFRPEPWQRAREAGFELATVLLGWNWTDAVDGQVDKPGIDRVFGISALREMGYSVKAHGVVWLQDYGILPERVKQMGDSEICAAAIAQERALLDAFGDHIAIWESLNEPAATNAVGAPRDAFVRLLGDASAAIKERPGLASLVNSPHEVDYGRKYLVFGLGGSPKDDFNLTYAAFLDQAHEAGALESVDFIGLQFYPGFRFNETFGGLEGPAVAPSWLVDTFQRYKQFGRPLHITEFSVPSSYGEDWQGGYWREPWDETTQADYAETIFTLAFGTPGVESITWWDISDAKPSVVTGGLIREDGTPKPVYERLKDLIDSWTTKQVSAETDASGVAVLNGYGGRYALQVEFPDGGILDMTAFVSGGEETTLPLEQGFLSSEGDSAADSEESSQ